MDLGQIGAALAPTQPGLRLRQGAIVSAQTDGTVTVTIGGSTTEVAGVRVMDGYCPQAGDTAWMASDGRDLFVIGRIGKPRIQAGTVTVTNSTSSTAAGTWGGTTFYHGAATVTFDVPFDAAPLVVLSPNGTLPWITHATATNITASGFDAEVARNNTTSTVVSWIAISA